MLEISKNQIIKSLGTLFSKEFGLDKLEKLKNHHRLQVFYHKGCACVTPGCSNIGTRIIRSIDNQGGIHWDLFTDDLILMTVDHIIPKKRGGSNTLNNYQPMCKICNNKKGHQNITLDELAEQVKVYLNS